jgi:hypothetical protein
MGPERRVMRCLQAYSMSLPLTYSGPLSTRIIVGFPRQAIIWFRLRTTRPAGKENPRLWLVPLG